MKRLAAMTAGAALVLSSIVGSPTVAGAASDAFRGTWISTDVDGSSQWLTIGGAGTVGLHSVRLLDDSASVCGGSPATVEGQAAGTGTSLTMAGVVTCRPGGNPFRSRITIAFEYSPDADTLTDSFGVTWHRS